MATDNRSGQPGNMAPLSGEFEIRQGSTGSDALTIVMSSGQSTTAGAALNIRRSAPVGSTYGEVGIFRAEYDGVWGRRVVESLAFGTATTVTLSASDSGKFLTIPANTSALTLTLPAMEAGIELEFYQLGAAGASGLTISAATAGDLVVKGDAAANSIVFGESTAKNIGASLRVVTDGTKWYSIMQPNVTSAAMATATMSLYQIKT